jgi:AcrR family transcriptional regulator
MTAIVTESRAPRLRAGQRTLRQILAAAVEIASVEGLEGLTIGRLADELEMSKSGLFAHFGSKEKLQLATIDAAREIFIEEVVRPALRQPRGIARLEALCRRWISYSERKVFRGGCFFAAAAAEFDSRPGPIRDRIAVEMLGWLKALETAVRKAMDTGELDPKTDAAQLAFEIHALMTAANFTSQLFGQKRSYQRAKVAIQRLIANAR